jgi:HEAT repeat protein
MEKKRDVKGLIKALTDKDRYVAHHAARALNRIGIQSLQVKDSQARYAAVMVLGRVLGSRHCTIETFQRTSKRARFPSKTTSRSFLPLKP